MHTISMEIAGEKIAVNFNSDWSGDALVFIGDDRNITMPAEIFVRVAKVINDRALDAILDNLQTPRMAGPNDLFEISSNNPPDPPDDDDETHEPQDYTGDYPLEGEDGEDE